MSPALSTAMDGSAVGATWPVMTCSIAAVVCFVLARARSPRGAVVAAWVGLAAVSVQPLLAWLAFLLSSGVAIEPRNFWSWPGLVIAELFMVAGAAVLLRVVVREGTAIAAGATMLVVGGGAGCVHASDLLACVTSLGLVGVGGLLLAREVSPRTFAVTLPAVVGRQTLWWSLLLLALALVYGATSSTQLDGLAGRCVAVFTRWGAAQPYVDALAEPGLSPAQLRHYRLETVDGMAPAALLIPALPMFAAALVLGVASWPGRSRAAPRPRGIEIVDACLLRWSAFIVLIRVFAVELAAPLFVLEPYGVARPMIGLGLVMASAGAWTVWRARYFGRLALGLAGVHAAGALILFAEAARARATGVDPGDAWVVWSGELAAACVWTMGTSGLALAVVLAIASRYLPVQGACRAAPLLTAAFVFLCAAPPMIGAWPWVVGGGAEASVSMSWSLVIAVGLEITVGVFALRRSLFVVGPVSSQASSRVDESPSGTSSATKH